MKTKTFLGLLLPVFLIAACKKERSCECASGYRNTIVVGNAVVYDSTYADYGRTQISYSKISKRDMQNECRSTVDSLITESNDSNAYYRDRIIIKRTCSIK